MKRLLTLPAVIVLLQSTLIAAPTHLDIMVPDLRDTDLRGPVKSVELKVWRNVSGEFTTERSEYDKAGNLVKSTESDENGKQVDVTTYIYDDEGCYKEMHYRNLEKKYHNDWEVILNPETRQIALREKSDGRIGMETYSPAGYLISYQLLNKDREPLVALQYQRDDQNRPLKYTRVENRKPEYTYYFKWAEDGFIDMERQVYHQEKEERLHTYEYLVTDEHGNWTQRIMVRYDVSDNKREKVYEHTVQRMIEYFDDADPAGAAAAPQPGEENNTTETPGTEQADG